MKPKKIFILGESLGGLVAHKSSMDNLKVDGIILLNPACEINFFFKSLS